MHDSMFPITDTYLGSVLSLCMERRGTQQSSINIDNHRVMMQFLLPLNEIIVDFHDHLKSISSGYASFDYEDYGFVPSKLVKVSSIMNHLKIRDKKFLPLGNTGKIPNSIIHFVMRKPKWRAYPSTCNISQSIRCLAMAWIIKQWKGFFSVAALGTSQTHALSLEVKHTCSVTTNIHLL